ncbi:MAG: divalent cation tolerance protein CutA [Candidatus Lokiarchaeota archaeon]|nr:divalent cation tolerance protein CutA [Candidatus Lokiarchaeota archaeon]
MYEIALITTSSDEEAEKIAKELVENHLVACANIISNIKSIYTWKGNIEKDTECLMIIKTKKDNRGKIIKKIKEIHSYETPECIFLPIKDGLKDYLNWIDESLKIH